jgi:predicted phage tail component-like protein
MSTLGYGFNFNGQHSSTFNLYVKSVDRSLFPSKKITQEFIPGTDGFLEREDGIQSREISVQCTLRNSDYHQRRIANIAIAKWLNSTSYQILLFDDEPDIFYRAKVRTPIKTRIMDAETDVFTLEFICYPFKYNTADRIIMAGSTDIMSDSTILIGSGDKKFTLDNSGHNIITFDIDSNFTIKDYKIKIEGTMSSIKINDMILSNIAGETWIDLGKKIVYQLDINSFTNKMKDFNINWNYIAAVNGHYTFDVLTSGKIGNGYITFLFENIYL